MFTRLLLLVLAGCLLVHPTAQSASPARVEVTARLYNTARMPPDITRTALAVATRALVAAAVDVAWRNCDSDSCAAVPAPRELVVRLVRSRGVSRGDAPFVLGEAAIDTGAGAGVLATIYVDHVERMAELSDTDVPVLLGRAIAHELGHLLLATNAHSSNGLMRAQWTPGVIRRNEMADWVLTRKDAEAIRKRLR